MLFLLLSLAFAGPSLETRLDEAVGWVDSGRARKGIPALDEIAKQRDSLTAAQAARLDRSLARAHVDIVDDVFEGDTAGHLDQAFAAWERCASSPDRDRASACNEDAVAYLPVFLKRAEALRTLLVQRRITSTAEALARCDQAKALAIGGMEGHACMAQALSTLGDAARAAENATHALEVMLPPGVLDEDDASQLDVIVASAIDLQLKRQADLAAAKALLTTLDARLDGRTPALPATDAARTSVANLEGKLDAPAEDADAATWNRWLKRLDAAGLHAAAARDAARARQAHPTDAALLERIGVVLVNAAAASTRRQIPDPPRPLLDDAASAFAACLEAEPTHPRCEAHSSRVAAQLAQLPE